MLPRLILAAFLLAHGALHASFLSPRPPVTAGAPAWPFDLAHSWALSPLGLQSDVTRLIGMALVAATVAGFGLASLSALGVAPHGMWLPSVALGSAGSAALLILFFHPWLVVGLGIDAAVTWAAFAGWSPTPAV
jgi:hypothetical protein